MTWLKTQCLNHKQNMDHLESGVQSHATSLSDACYFQCDVRRITALQRQAAVTAYLKSKQLLLFALQSKRGAT